MAGNHAVGLHYRASNDNNVHQTKTQSEKQEIGDWAVWSLSSAKPGFGVQQLRDDDFNTYWQSDGDQPHYINIQFHKKMTIQEVALQVSYKLDETYTPCDISIRSGTTFNDLIEIKKLSLNKAEGWVYIPLSDEEEWMRTNFLQIVILSMHLGGRDTHIRQVKVYGPRNPVSSALKIPYFDSVEFTMYSTLR